MKDNTTEKQNGGRMREEDYQLLAEFRKTLREFLHFSEQAAVAAGVTPRQHQAMLVIRGALEGDSIIIGDLAQQLHIKHQSAVGLFNRMEKAGLIEKEHDPADRRRIFLRLTKQGNRLLAGLSVAHKSELKRIGPTLDEIVKKLRKLS